MLIAAVRREGERKSTKLHKKWVLMTSNSDL